MTMNLQHWTPRRSVQGEHNTQRGRVVMITWIHAGPSVAAAFLGSLVECVEAATIVLAVGTVRGWRSALAGALAGVAVLAGLVGLLGPALSTIPVSLLQVVIGVLLLLFGLSWLRKAAMRAGGVMPLRDEQRAFASTTATLRMPTATTSRRRWDRVALIASFKAVLLEGVEVVFIVLAAGAASQTILPASLGAVGATLVVTLAALALRRPLARVPENTLKFTVAVLLASFGTFWVVEGLGIPWPGGDLAILGLAAAFFAGSLVMVEVLRRHAGAMRRSRGAA